MKNSVQQISLKQAKRIVLQHARGWGEEIISLNGSSGRVLAEKIIADRDYPPFHRATMDGYALQFDGVASGRNAFKLAGKVMAGESFKKKLSPRQCISIMTGAPVPHGADTVVKLEDAVLQDREVIFLGSVQKKGQYIAKKGEDARKGQLLVNCNQVIDAPLTGLLASLSKTRIRVSVLPSVAIISTGHEIIPAETPLSPNRIRDFNSWALRAFLEKYRISDISTMIIPDELQKIAAGMIPLLDRDMLILSGGVSKGQADLVPEVLKSLGIREVFHWVKIKPGQPIWFGQIPNGGIVFGLPGNPISVQVAFKVFIEPFLRQSFGLGPIADFLLPLAVARKKRTPFDEFFPVRIQQGQSVPLLVPVPMNGSGDIRATALTAGLALHPSKEADLKPGRLLKFFSW